jgi:hypothetical protein
MAITIPSGVYTKYEEVADLMISEFGVTCTLSYVTKVETTAHSIPHAKQQRTMNIGDRSAPTAFGRGTTTYKEEEMTADITMRVYWTKKEWRKIASMSLADGAIMCLGYLSDLSAINRATKMKVAVATDDETYEFVKAAEPFPWGFKKRRYLVSFWERS